MPFFISYLSRACRSGRFLVSPLRKKASHTEPVQNLIDNFKGKRWEQYYTLSFVDKLVKGEKGDNFNFGMEWFDVFQIKR